MAFPVRPRGLGVPFFLLLLYPVFDYGRPPNPMGIPMVISIVLALAWIASPAKKANAQIVCFLLLIAALTIGSLGAVNHGSAYFAVLSMAIILLCICSPLIHFVDSLRKVKIFVNLLIAVFLYVGLWAVMSGGNGPAGSGGGQDENYTSAMMCMAIPLAYFSLPLTKSRVVKLCYVVALGVFVAAVVVSSSRGGFLGLIGAALFCALYSPRKKRAFAGLLVGAALALAVAGPSYWEEMETITDTKESTADMRLELWTIAARMFAHNPLFGVGPGNFRWNAGTYQSAEQVEKFGRELTYSVLVHSTYFEILSEWGLVGTILFATILIRTFGNLRRLRSAAARHSEPPSSVPASAWPERSNAQQVRFYSLALSGCLVGYLIPAAFVSFTYFSHFWVIAALAAALDKIVKDTARTQTVASEPSISAA